ncbi:RtcB family protein [Undibacterium cyanobacteriorum]|uniref:3'-phosphate/5'-hydroxy nucleic acid ligase n=1 Tax=Undibacterium cyanobacteriorum TaxID=3073561 RepID=A0ABY9RMQ5_9BURK|nr:RtcB family protein [Undibacterium sp. 20NA77.5]WMW81702.1 RtcB family protein [Undibacterium sp. 20NA77.5]
MNFSHTPKQTVSAKRLAKALASHGIEAQRDGNIIKVRSLVARDVHAEILLPESLPLEAKAVSQLLDFAGVWHPDGGHVCRACATPDFHPSTLVPVGSVLVTSHDFVIPQAVGTDINCGMRLHVIDLSLEEFLSKKAELVRLLKLDLLEGQRNLPTTPESMRALFNDGLSAFWTHTKRVPQCLFAQVDFQEVERELQRLSASSHVRHFDMINF